MANHPIPDLSTLLSSSQIFSSPSSYNLPHIRAIHKALHAEIDDKQARLRTQVGGSYRELLGTADTIVQMRGDMEAVQATLGRMGAKCGRAVVKGKMDGLLKWEEAEEGGGVDNKRRMREAARVKILEGCVLGVQRLLRREEKHGKGGDITGRKTMRVGSSKVEEKKDVVMSKGDKLLLAAKVCVLGRLLVKTFEREQGGIFHAEASRTAVKSADRSLTVLRDRLLRCIDSVLVSVNEKLTPRSDLLKALSAYSLHTGSGARDTLRYFLQVRGSALAMSIENWSEGQQPSAAVRTPKDILRRLNLYAKTLQDVQALAPNKLADALAGLKKKALLADDGLRAIEGLRLDIYSRWCGDEIRYYTPFIRHDDLPFQDVNSLLFEWAPVHRDVFITDLNKTVKSMSEFKAIVDLRTSVLRLWIAESSRVKYNYTPTPSDNDDDDNNNNPETESTAMFNLLRSTINSHLLSVIDTKVHKLRLVGSEASAALAAWREGTTDQHLSLWDPSAFAGIDLTVPSSGPSGSGGGAAQQFASEVISRLYGRNDAVSKAVASYKSWFHVIDDVGSVVEQLRRQRWESDFGDDEEDSSLMVEDEETIEQRQQLLSREDPERLTKHLSESLLKAFAALDEHLTDLWEKQKGGPNRGQIAMYLLRLLRDIRSRLPEQQQHGEGIKGFGLRTIPSLHEALAKTVLVSPVDEFVTVALARKTVVGRGLWEGNPELPTGPSPGMFRFLRNLSAAMADAGADLWSPAAVRELKKEVRGEVCRVWLEAARGVLEEADDAKTAEKKKKKSDEKDEGGDEGEQKKKEEGKEENKEEPSEKGEEPKTTKDTDNDTAAKEEAEAEAQQQLQKQEADREKANQQRRDLFVQWLLDIIYLGIFLDGRNGDFNEIANTVFQHSGLDPGDKGRLVKAAQEYYKRTQLLFGLLT